MTNDNSLTLAQMRMERETYEATYIQFIAEPKYHNSHAFCFYEGEDGKYYDSRIRQKFGNRIITHTVGNKKEVLKLLKKIRSIGLYDSVCTMFFIDRDCDESMAGSDKDLFETPCYSIENLYVQKECLLKILQSEFGLNEITQDCKKCIQDFEAREMEFNQHILEFNALAYLRRKKSDSNSNMSLNSVKTSHMVQVKVRGVTKASKYEQTIQQLREKLEFEEYELEQVKTELIDKGEFSLNFRGKNQLDFFVGFIKELKRLNKTGGYFSKKYNNIHINITSNRLSELSQYAVTPICLEQFLESHKVKLSN